MQSKKKTKKKQSMSLDVGVYDITSLHFACVTLR